MASQGNTATPLTLTPEERALAAVRSLSFFKSANAEVLLKIAAALEPVELAAGEVLVRQGDAGDALFLVETGELRALISRPDGSQIEVGRIFPGQPIGEMQLIGGGVRSATVEAFVPTTLFKFERAALNRLASEIPEAIAVAMKVTRQRLHASQFRLALPRVFGPLTREVIEEIEKRVEWVNVARGEALFRQGDECDGWYLLLTGRLRVVVGDPKTGEERGVRDISPGESLGEIALITGERRTATPYAIRDSLAARFSVKAFEEIMERFPKVLLSITKTLISVQQNASRPKPPPSRMAIAVVPASESPAAREFAQALTKGLSLIGSTRHIDARKLSEEGVLDNASKISKDHASWLRFSGWLEDQQTTHAFMVLETDPAPTGWAHRALGQADHVVIVADARDNKIPGQLETELLGGEVSKVRRAKRTLVLVHQPDTKLPSHTHEWLGLRHVDAHLHVKAGSQEDAERVARTITGRAVGLALGGGGARGYAHFGVVRALRELKIPIDVIGGTSMGSIMAGQMALGLTMDELYQLNREIMAIRPFSEYTVPMVAMLKTTGIARSAKMAFGDTRIEDLWLPYFAISSNLTTAEMVVHDTGPVWEATRASGSLPGIAIPVVRGKHLLVDGGVINNLPGDVMREKCGGGPVIAVNVSPEEDVGMSHEEFPSQWSLFWNRFLPGQTRILVPGILDILMRTTLLASSSRTLQVQRAADLYLRPPIDKFGTLDFEKMDELAAIGYSYTMETAAGFKHDAVREPRS